MNDAFYIARINWRLMTGAVKIQYVSVFRFSKHINHTIFLYCYVLTHINSNNIFYPSLLFIAGVAFFRIDISKKNTVLYN
jgi:hypothetical protein